MIKLLRGNIARLLKSKIFWICTAAVFLVAVYIMQMGGIAVKKRAVTLDEYFFYLGPVVALFFSVFISLFIGTEHSDGTVRNKLIVGHSRKQVYLSYYLTCLVGTEVMIAAWFLGGLTGMPVLGVWKTGAAAIFTNILITMLYCALLTAIFVFLSVMMQNKATSAVVQIVFAIVLILWGSILYNHLCEPEEISGMMLINGEIVMGEPEPNPTYIGGTLRQVCIALVNILPTGQGILMLHQESYGSVPILIPLQIISSILLALGITTAGVMLFRRKDLK